MPGSRLAKRSSNTHDKRFVTQDTEPSQETEYFLNQFFHNSYSREEDAFINYTSEELFQLPRYHEKQKQVFRGITV